MLAAFPSLCLPTHPKPSELSLSHYDSGDQEPHVLRIVWVLHKILTYVENQKLTYGKKILMFEIVCTHLSTQAFVVNLNPYPNVKKLSAHARALLSNLNYMLARRAKTEWSISQCDQKKKIGSAVCGPKM